jgi:hypothetical protein
VSGNVLVAGPGIGLQQIGSLHDHPRLAIAALRNILLDPGPLHRMQAIIGRRKALDGRDATAGK